MNKIHGIFYPWPERHLKGSGCKRCSSKNAMAPKQSECANLFVEKAYKIHGNKYDYSKTKYIASNKKVIVICKIHGEFMQIASLHLQGSGCRLCAQISNQIHLISGQKRKKTSNIPMEKSEKLNDIFIEKAKNIHGNRYDYKNVNYVNNHTKINIICFIHGPFKQSPDLHINRKAGCKLCAHIVRAGERAKRAGALFIEKAQRVHGLKYDYTQSIYIKSSKKLEIICLKHGSFFITPNSHLNGSGCVKCGTESRREKRSKGGKTFILQAQTIHGSKYDYSLVEYISSHRHVIIICRMHGKFSQTPSGHLTGYGCRKCGIQKQSDNSRDSLENFLIKAKNVHGKKYDYSQAIYKSSSSKLKIICPMHGLFLQRPDKHLTGHGCLSCANRDMDTAKFISRAQEIHGKKYDYSKSIYTTAKANITIICPDHGIFEQCAWNHMNGTGCELCVDQFNSRGIKCIELWLKANNISYSREKTFKDLRSSLPGNKLLRFDFYLLDYNILIEFDGEQHFKPNHFWGGETAFQNLRKNDNRKNLWCKDKGYELIRINYQEINVIEKILSSRLKLYIKN